MKRFIEDYQPAPDASQNPDFDIIVLGGGITGAAVAYEAAAHGYRVCLLEKKDFGWATSAATSKMIHGGLRYLNNLEFGLVRESLRERRILEDIAPNYVYPLPFMIPNYKGHLMSNRWVIKMGMILYDLLSFDKGWTRLRSKRIPLHQSLSAAKARAQESILPTDGLTGAAVYYDCQSIFPERLTLAFIKSAEYHGARVANYAEVSDFIREGNQIRGVVVRDHLRGGSDVRVYGRLLINSGGPWAEHMLRRMAGENLESHLRTSEGIHIIVNRPLVKDHAVALITPEGRHFFLVPWRNHTLIGTTDREYTGKPDEYRVTRESVDEFLKEINDTLGANTVRHQDIVHTYGGLRPLTDTTAKSSYKSSRKYEILDSAELGMEGVLTVEGGKYTTSRNLAVNVLKLARKKLDAMGVQSHGARYNTARKPLFGCEIPSMSGFLEHVAEKYPDVSAETRDFIARNYGTDFQNILEIAKENPAWARPRNADGEILAEVVFSIRREMARTLEDILLRRTGFGTLGMPDDDLLKDIAQLAAGELGHDQNWVADQIKHVHTMLTVP